MAATKKSPAKPAKAERKARVDKPVEGYRASDMAKDLKVEPKAVRLALRDLDTKKPGSRWVWESKSAAEKVIAAVKAHLEATPAKTPRKAKAEKKETAPAKKAEKKSAPKRLKKPSAEASASA